MLTEARVLLPGAQALLGFQLAVILNDTFSQLPQSSKLTNVASLCCISLAIILLNRSIRLRVGVSLRSLGPELHDPNPEL